MTARGSEYENFIRSLIENVKEDGTAKSIGNVNNAERVLESSIMKSGVQLVHSYCLTKRLHLIARAMAF